MGGVQKPTPHSELKRFAVRVIVAGSRGYANYREFSGGMHDYVAKLDVPRDTIIFITGRAKTGADDMIIFWCRENGYPWAEFEPDWEDITVEGAVVRYRRDGSAFNVIAGHMRNGQMAEYATNLMVWWDGVSKGTKDMLTRAKAKNLDVDIILIDVEEPTPKERGYGRQSQSGGSRDSEVRGQAAAW